jgi:glycerophosphoryl diester phosphodiesterase
MNTNLCRPRKTVGAFKSLAVLPFVFFVLVSITVNVIRADIVNVAHRGDSINAPENTLAAINSAVGFADFTEFDVRVTAEGELVAIHDATVNRTTNGTGAVAAKTLAELKLLDAGSWFSPDYTNKRIPTLAESMNAALAGNITPVVERKTGSAARYNANFESLGLDKDDFRVIAFDWNFLGSLDSIDDSYHLGALGSGILDQQDINDALANGADFLNWNHNNIDQNSVNLAHENGLELYVYTVDSESRMRELIGFGVDGITTNDPRLLNSVSVPEPSSGVLLGALGLLLFGVRKRQG